MIAALEKTEAAVQTLAVSEKVVVTQKEFNSPVTHDLEREADWIVTAGRRIWFAMEGETLNLGTDAVTKRRRQVEFSFDGRQARSISTLTASDGTLVQSGEVRDHPIWYSMNPLELTLHLFNGQGEPISRELKTEARPYRVAGRAVHDGRPVVVIERAPFTDEKGTQWSRRCHVDLERAITVRQSLMHRPRGEIEWRENALVETFDHAKAPPGVWLPGRYVRRTGIHTRDDGETVFFNRFVGTLTGWGVNDAVGEDQFRLKFFDDVRVNDHRQGGNGRLLTLDEVRGLDEPAE